MKRPNSLSHNALPTCGIAQGSTVDIGGTCDAVAGRGGETAAPSVRPHAPSDMNGSPLRRLTAREKRDEEGKCRICGFTKEMLRHPPPKNGCLTMHHLIPRLQRGRDDVDNLVPLCFRCHRIVDSNKPANVTERERLRRVLRANLAPAEIVYVNLMMGRGYIDRAYPPAPLIHQRDATHPPASSQAQGHTEDA